MEEIDALFPILAAEEIERTDGARIQDQHAADLWEQLDHLG
jgi:hypothetical protein